MKRDHKLLISGVAFVVLAGMLSASAQDATKTGENPSGAATPTTAQKPAADPNQPAKPELTIAEKRAEIDRTAKETHATVFAKSPEAKKLYDKSYGCAIFDNVKLAFLVSGGGGKGVAMARLAPQNKTYMNMGTAGVGVGIGAHKYQLFFLFQTKERYDKFVNEGWVADVSAAAVAGEAGANAEATFQDGIVVYQITDAGLMLNADIAGMKFWRDDELNMKHDQTD